MTHPDDDDYGYGPRLWDADPDVCCAAFQLGACAHTEAYEPIAGVDYEVAVCCVCGLDQHTPEQLADCLCSAIAPPPDSEF